MLERLMTRLVGGAPLPPPQGPRRLGDARRPSRPAPQQLEVGPPLLLLTWLRDDLAPLLLWQWAIRLRGETLAPQSPFQRRLGHAPEPLPPVPRLLVVAPPSPLPAPRLQD